MNICVFIFARGGSKGLPKKNIKKLAGKPLIQYSIDIGQKIPGVNYVFVSTDDREIATIAAASGAIIIDRPSELATDHCPEWLAWRHAVEFVRNHYGDFDLFVSLPTTSPLRSIEDVVAAIEAFKNKEADVCISVTPASRSPFFNMVVQDTHGYCRLLDNSKEAISRRQNSPEVFDMTTVVYVTRPEYIMNNDRLFDGKVISVKIPKIRAIDIDDIYDFMFAEVLLKNQDTVYVEE